MVLIIWGRLPSGMRAAWAGSQDSGHSDPTGGRFGGEGKRTACIDQSPIQRIKWGELRFPSGDAQPMQTCHKEREES